MCVCVVVYACVCLFKGPSTQFDNDLVSFWFPLKTSNKNGVPSKQGTPFLLVCDLYSGEGRPKAHLGGLLYSWHIPKLAGEWVTPSIHIPDLGGRPILAHTAGSG